ncbi:hypothetical protein ACGFMK_03600 [Amycolatopsis sp. NPDC049252]
MSNRSTSRNSTRFSEACTDATDEVHGNDIAIVMRPDRWNTSDFSDLGEG